MRSDSYRPLSRDEIEILREDLLNVEGWLPEGRARMNLLCDMALKQCDGPNDEAIRLLRTIYLSWALHGIPPELEADIKRLLDATDKGLDRG